MATTERIKAVGIPPRGNAACDATVQQRANGN